MRERSEARRFAQRLKQARQEAGLTQVELAAKLKTVQHEISSFESGTRRVYLETAARLADALGVSLDYLAGHTKRR